jgi:hypothetical protein
LGDSRPNLIRSHAPRLPGRRPSLAVHLFGGYGPRSQVLLLRITSAWLQAMEEARARAPPAGHFKQAIETCEPLDTIFDEIDLLENDPPHRGVAMRNSRFRPYWIQAEEKEWQGLWEKGVFKKWSRKDLLSNDRVFTSRYVYKLKRSARTGEV